MVATAALRSGLLVLSALTAMPAAGCGGGGPASTPEAGVDAGPTPEECAPALSIQPLLGMPCSAATGCPQPAGDAGLFVDCLTVPVFTTSDASCTVEGTCRLVCNASRWPETACPPLFSCGGIADDVCKYGDPVGLCGVVAACKD